LGTRSTSNKCNPNAAAKDKSFKPQFPDALGARISKPSSSITTIQIPCITLYKDAHNFTNMQVVGERQITQIYDRSLLLHTCSYFFPEVPEVPRSFTLRTLSSFAMIC